MNRLKLNIQRFADGEIIIGTDLDTAKLEAKLNKLQRKLENEKMALSVKEAELNTARSETDEIAKNIEEQNKFIEEQKRNLDEINRRYDKINQKIKDGQSIQGFEYVRLEQLASEKARLEDIIKFNEGDGTLEKQFDKALVKAEALESEVEKQKGVVAGVNDELKVANLQLEKASKNAKIENASLEKIGNSMQNIVHKVKKWALAIFGVRSAYMFIRQAMSTLSQSDEQLATNIEYIKWALATTIKPIIEWIVKAVYTVLALIGSLVKAIFGVNIFANATADAFKKQKESMNGTNKEAKQLQKTLAGFDEMNVLQENGTTTSGGGFTPEIDLGELSEPSTIKKLKKFWKEIFDFWEKDWKNVFNSLGGKWGNFIQGLILTVKGFWDVLKGIGELIIGLVQMIVGLVTGNFELVKQGFNIMIEGIKNILIGALEIISGLLLTVFGFVKGIFLTIWDFIYNYFIKPVTNAFSGLIDIVKKPFTAIVDAVKGLWEKIKKPIEELVKKINKALDKINPINLWDDIKSGAKSGWNKVKSFFGFAKGGIVYNNLPKLASGGVINQPGRGVPIASAVGGERGAEGVIPLTDSQQMALLGEAIGRYVNISATIPVYVGNRKVAREVRKIQANEDFAFNR